ncbi:MAG: secretin N-terminal domain-containing protein [Acidobacteriota bacterium]
MKIKYLAVPLLMVLLAGQLVPQVPPAQTAAPPPVISGSLNLQGASLREVIDTLARQLRINVMIDDKVQGSVTLNTYGTPVNLDVRNLLELILRLNNAGMIQEGDIYRIVPTKELVRQPFSDIANSADVPDDDRTMLNLIFLKYVTVDEVSKILQEFTDERTVIKAYGPANLLFLMDSRRNIRRLMSLIEMFDSDTFAGERIRIFDIANTLPSELLKDLEHVLSSISLDRNTSTVRFLPVDRIGKLIAVAPNPGVFERVETWIRTLDVAITSTSSLIDTYVYHVNYGRADCLAMSLNQLYMSLSPYGGYASPYGGGYNGVANGGPGLFAAPQNFGGGGNFGNTGFGTNFGNGGGQNSNNGGYGSQNGFNNNFGGGSPCGSSFGNGGGMGGYGGGGYGGGYGGGGYGAPSFGGFAAQVPLNSQGIPMQPQGNGQQVAQAPRSSDGTDSGSPPPRIVPNPLDNSLLIQANAQQYQSILKLLRDLDRPPRQILLEAKIYQVVMGGSFSGGVQNALLQSRSGTDRRLRGSLQGAVTQLQAGVLVGQARELLALLQLTENASYAKVISEPRLIATDSIPASISVGAQVPVLTGTVSTLGGNSAFTTQGIGSRNTGVTLQVNARVNPSGVVVLVINQEISKQSGNGTAAIPTPTFDQQLVQTQITMQDGDTIAIGGVMSESSGHSSQGLPGLHKIPGVGMLFGSQTRDKQRTELILFMTPHVIYDRTDLLEASEQVKNSMRKVRKLVVE